MKNANNRAFNNRVLAIDFQVLKFVSSNFLIAAAKGK
jgi:hypothetical protein